MSDSHDVDLEGAGVGQGKRKLFILVGVALGGAVVAGGALFATGVLGGKSEGQAQAAEAGEQAAPDGEDGEAAAQGAPHKTKGEIKTIEIKPFAVNLADEDKSRFARVGLALVVPKDADLDQFNELIPLMQGATLPVLMATDSETLRSAKGLADTCKKLTAAAKKADPSHTLLDVSIYELVIQ